MVKTNFRYFSNVMLPEKTLEIKKKQSTIIVREGGRNAVVPWWSYLKTFIILIYIYYIIYEYIWKL